MVGWMAPRAVSLALAVAALALGAPAAVAQTASQLTPRSFEPQPPGGGATIVFSGQPGLETPPGAERLTVTVGRVTVDGAFPELDAANKAFVARLAGRRIPASEIFAATRALEAAYAQAGYVLARVVLPQQQLRNGGSLRIVVVDGFIERADVSRVPERVRGRVAAVVAPLVGQRHLTIGVIERRLLIAGDTPGVGLRSALSRGTATGATVLTIEGTYSPAYGMIDADNTLASALGRTTTGVGVDLNSVLGLGESAYLRVTGHLAGNDQNGLGGLGTDHPRYGALAGGVWMPIGTDGLKFNLEAVETRATLKAPAAPEFATVFDRVTALLRYPWIRSRTLDVGTEASFDVENETASLVTPIASLPVWEDAVRVARLSGDVTWHTGWGGTLFAKAILSFGIDAFGARDGTPALPLSRAGASPDFQKFEALVDYSQPLLPHLAMNLYARGQTSFGQPLVLAEQIGLASFQELSTFDAGTLGGDSGWVVRAELNSPWSATLDAVALQVVPYAFGATGMLFLANPSALEHGTVRVSSIGVGVRLGSTVVVQGLPQAALTLEYGRRFRSDQLPDDNRFTLVSSTRF
ncbi:MAG TPA: ShlB/FhaC/HecB family hemolysin secretion/activation protein [Hyphomicrobiales bacterium]|nr:ShlB/FhaC/HecB family hemolysin secretion/activation protein [Hyphomicrobiales bacterium]